MATSKGPKFPSFQSCIHPQLLALVLEKVCSFAAGVNQPAARSRTSSARRLNKQCIAPAPAPRPPRSLVVSAAQSGNRQSNNGSGRSNANLSNGAIPLFRNQNGSSSNGTSYSNLDPVYTPSPSFTPMTPLKVLFGGQPELKSGPRVMDSTAFKASGKTAVIIGGSQVRCLAPRVGCLLGPVLGTGVLWILSYRCFCVRPSGCVGCTPAAGQNALFL